MKTTRLFATTNSGSGQDSSTLRVIAAQPFTGPAADRYQFIKRLGSGGFGDVFLARDEELQRLVAVKLWRRRSAGFDDFAIGCLEEARTLARLDHPAIVPIYDVGTTRQGQLFIISKFVDGEPLTHVIKKGAVASKKAAAIAMRIALALDHAHTKGLVHRDVKPANILIDQNGLAHLIDFGIAMREDLLEMDSRVIGTPAYMSPEQARGEGHMVGRRSDVFSLGVVFFELLTGERAFSGDTVSRILASVESQEPPQPSSIVTGLASQLDRICQKAMARRSRDRFASGKEFAEDLESYLQESSKTVAHRAMIVPKGLRSFDSDDADFFLRLLPGPRDRTGLPEVLRFWKQRVESTNVDETFRVGVLCGPSGCGKSSFLKAGLIPQLSGRITTVFVEADASIIEGRILRTIQRKRPTTERSDSLIETLTQLRRQLAASGDGHKMLIVIDQFEQWLNSNPASSNNRLIQALRQCDGENVQCLISVRDDFWLSATRFMSALEVDLDQTVNVGIVDLFDARHARLVLREFGRAHGRLPQAESPEAEQFLNHAIADLAEDSRIVPIRLAVFAEMMKSRDWTPEHLDRIGGATGLGRAFLEDAIGESAANLFLRQHRETAKQILHLLLPDTGTSIKGTMKSLHNLWEQCDQRSSQTEFRRLVKTLDQELRLITPVDTSEQVELPTTEEHFQLTHDFLVPAIRDWLNGQRQSTREGRAQILLEQRSQAWGQDRRNRLLPDLFEWIRIRLVVSRRNWSEIDRHMMSAANRFHTGRLVMVVAVLLIAMLITREVLGRIEGRDLTERIVNSDVARLPALMSHLPGVKRWTLPHLHRNAINLPATQSDGINARIALLSEGDEFLPECIEKALTAEPGQLPAIAQILRQHAPESERVLLANWHDAENSYSRRLRAAASLATFGPSNFDSAPQVADLAAWLSRQPTDSLPQWTRLFQPVVEKLRTPLLNLFNRSANQTRRSAAVLLCSLQPEDETLIADLLEQIAPADIPDILALPRIDPKELSRVLRSRFNPAFSRAVTDDAERDAFAQRQANSALALIRLGQQAVVWPQLRANSDPRFRHFVVHNVHNAGVDPAVFLNRLRNETEVSIRRALLLALGEFPSGAIPPSDRERMISEATRLLAADNDSGVHSIAEWLLRKNHETEVLDKMIDGAKANYSTSRNWFINRSGMTFAVVRGGVDFRMGTTRVFTSMPGNEAIFDVRIPRDFALGTKELTVAEFARYRDDLKHIGENPLAPAVRLGRNDVMRYCRWLSLQEGFPERELCYQIGDDGTIRTADDFLNRSGYRLPTEAEWEYCCRAGSVTIRPWGATAEWLSRFAWTDLNSSGELKAVASLRPNEFGFFDMLGNAAEWCQDSYRRQLDSSRLVIDNGPPIDKTGEFVARGASGRRLHEIRSAARRMAFAGGSPQLGFRITRTVNPGMRQEQQ